MIIRDMQTEKSPRSQTPPGTGAFLFHNTGYNPLMSHEPGSIHARLRETADHAWRMYCALEITVPYRTASGFDAARPPKQRLSASPTPGNSVAIALTIDFHREIRRLESQLNARITGAPKRRGSSSANTRYAIDSVVKLCTTSDQETVLGVLGYMTAWNRRADIFFNPQKGLHRLPRQPGEGEARCPYCQRATMRWSPDDGIAVCVKPDCRDTDGQRPRWSAQFIVLAGQLVFRWDEMQEAAA